MLRVEASNLPSPKGALRSRRLLPQPPQVEAARQELMLPPADPAAPALGGLAVQARERLPSRPRDERWSVRLELAADEIAKLYGQGMTRGAVVWRKGMVEWRPLLITAELAGLLRRTRTTFTSAGAPAGSSAPVAPLAPEPGRVPESILPPELAARPVTPITVAPTAIDIAPQSKPRRGVELVAVAVAAFALAWVGRGNLSSREPTTPAAELSAASAPASCEPTAPTPIPVASPAPLAAPPAIAVTDLPLLTEPAAFGSSRSVAHATRRASAGAGPSRSELVAALSRVAQSARGCGERGGPVRLMMSFTASGVARGIRVSGDALPAPTRSCIIAAASRARVPAFAGDPVTVSKTL